MKRILLPKQKKLMKMMMIVMIAKVITMMMMMKIQVRQVVMKNLVSLQLVINYIFTFH